MSASASPGCSRSRPPEGDWQRRGVRLILTRAAGEGDRRRRWRGRVRATVLSERRARMLRRQMSLPEVVLSEQLRGGRLEGLRFRRRHPLGPYILDALESVLATVRSMAG
ncbi:MAG: DUF559 domain-containing protein [Bauldia sp.]